VVDYRMQIASLACIYWVLIAGLNLIVGYAGQLAIGFVGLLAIAHTSGDPVRSSACLPWRPWCSRASAAPSSVSSSGCHRCD
jgi:hypothetical protein